MVRISTSFNFTKTCKNYLYSEAESLNLKNSTYMESLVLLHAINNGFIPTNTELANLRKNFLVNNHSNITGDFRNQISTLNDTAQLNILKLIYSLNLCGVAFSTKKQANLSKSGQLCCYFALGVINHKPIDDYLKSFNHIIATIGPSSTNSNEYLFFTNIQQFKIPKIYPKFNEILIALNLPLNTQVIRVHYNNIDDIIHAFETI